MPHKEAHAQSVSFFLSKKKPVEISRLKRFFRVLVYILTNHWISNFWDSNELLNQIYTLSKYVFITLLWDSRIWISYCTTMCFIAYTYIQDNVDIPFRKRSYCRLVYASDDGDKMGLFDTLIPENDPNLYVTSGEGTFYNFPCGSVVNNICISSNSTCNQVSSLCVDKNKFEDIYNCWTQTSDDIILQQPYETITPIISSELMAAVSVTLGFLLGDLIQRRFNKNSDYYKMYGNICATCTSMVSMISALRIKTDIAKEGYSKKATKMIDHLCVLLQDIVVISISEHIVKKDKVWPQWVHRRMDIQEKEKPVSTSKISLLNILVMQLKRTLTSIFVYCEKNNEILNDDGKTDYATWGMFLIELDNNITELESRVAYKTPLVSKRNFTLLLIMYIGLLPFVLYPYMGHMTRWEFIIVNNSISIIYFAVYLTSKNIGNIFLDTYDYNNRLSHTDWKRRVYNFFTSYDVENVKRLHELQDSTLTYIEYERKLMNKNAGDDGDDTWPGVPLIKSRVTLRRPARFRKEHV